MENQEYGKPSNDAEHLESAQSVFSVGDLVFLKSDNLKSARIVAAAAPSSAGARRWLVRFRRGTSGNYTMDQKVFEEQELEPLSEIDVRPQSLGPEWSLDKAPLCVGSRATIIGAHPEVIGKLPHWMTHCSDLSNQSGVVVRVFDGPNGVSEVSLILQHHGSERAQVTIARNSLVVTAAPVNKSAEAVNGGSGVGSGSGNGNRRIIFKRSSVGRSSAVSPRTEELSENAGGSCDVQTSLTNVRPSGGTTYAFGLRGGEFVRFHHKGQPFEGRCWLAPDTGALQLRYIKDNTVRLLGVANARRLEKIPEPSSQRARELLSLIDSASAKEGARVRIVGRDPHVSSLPPGYDKATLEGRCGVIVKATGNGLTHLHRDGTEPYYITVRLDKRADDPPRLGDLVFRRGSVVVTSAPAAAAVVAAALGNDTAEGAKCATESSLSSKNNNKGRARAASSRSDPETASGDEQSEFEAENASSYAVGKHVEEQNESAGVGGGSSSGSSSTSSGSSSFNSGSVAIGSTGSPKTAKRNVKAGGGYNVHRTDAPPSGEKTFKFGLKGGEYVRFRKTGQPENLEGRCFVVPDTGALQFRYVKGDSVYLVGATSAAELELMSEPSSQRARELLSMLDCASAKEGARVRVIGKHPSVSKLPPASDETALEGRCGVIVKAMAHWNANRLEAEPPYVSVRLDKEDGDPPQLPNLTFRRGSVVVTSAPVAAAAAAGTSLGNGTAKGTKRAYERSLSSSDDDEEGPQAAQHGVWP